MTTQLSITDFANDLQLRYVLSAIPEQMITEVISFINPDVAQTYTEILRLNETMPNEQRCILATADGGSDDGFETAYNRYNPNINYVFTPSWQDLCQMTALKKVGELLYVPADKLTPTTFQYYSAKHALERVSYAIQEDGVRFKDVQFASLPQEYTSFVGYVNRTNTILSFILGGRFKYEWRTTWRTTPNPKIGGFPQCFFYVMAKRTHKIFVKQIAEHQYKHGIITDLRCPVTNDYTPYKVYVY
jgi:hypothetical protein